MDSLTIYKSSAGSGKTTVLTREYLKLALAGNFRSILAVTFTNKATNELKDRVVSWLSDFSNESEPGTEASGLMHELGMEHPEFKDKCRNVLDSILNNYGLFSISTIDAFFQKIIRSFARESGIQGNFRLELEPDLILDEAIGRLLSEAGSNETLTRWLIRFSNEAIEKGDSSDLSYRIRGLGTEVFKEEFKVIQERVAEEGTPERFIKLESDLYGIARKFSDVLSEYGKNILADLHHAGLFPSDLKAGIGKQLELLASGEIPDYTKVNFVAAIAAPENWFTKSSKKKHEILTVLNAGTWQKLAEADRYIHENEADFQTAKVILENLYTYGIISDLLRKIDEYKLENDILLLSDSSLFLSKIIKGYDSPFIYEKVGTRYQHFLIDEFQDTSRFQWYNFRPLLENSIAEGEKSVLVGDVKQSIYRWRGGDWDLLGSDVERDISTSDIEELTVNWRSRGRVIQFNNRLFSEAVIEMSSMFSRDASKKAEMDIVAELEQHILELYRDVEQQLPENTDPDSGFIQVEMIGNEHNFESLTLARLPSLIEDLQEKGLRARDIAILVRKRQEGEKVAAVLIEHARSEKARPGINYDVVSSEILRVANSPSVNLVIALMRWLNRPEDRISLVSFITDYKIYFNENEEGLDKVFERIYNKNLDDLLPEFFERDLAQISRLQLYELSEEIIRRFGLKDRKQEWPYLLGFQDELLKYVTREAGDLDSFLKWWDAHGWEVPVNISEDINAIRIMTIHKAKGLQFEAVILPFCSWKIEPEGIKNEIIWASSDREPFSQFSVYPLKYSSQLARSHFRKDYLEEKARHYIDNLNLLYVAFTRAIQAMYILFPEDDKDDKVSSLLTSVFSGWMLEGKLVIGSQDLKPGDNGNDSDRTMELNEFHSSRWNDKVTVATRELIKLRDDVYTKVESGILMHDILSDLVRPDELDELLLEYLRKGRLPIDRQEEIGNLLREILSRKEVRSMFTDGEIINEGVILGKKGLMRRPDKVIVRENEVIVVDFKTGDERPEHSKQVVEYVDLLSEIYNKKVRGYLLYLQPFSLKEIE